MDMCSLMFPASYPEMKECKSLLMIGGASTCKTSLLLQMACSLSYQYCKRFNNDDCTVMFISNYKLSTLPFHVHRMPPFNSTSAKNISVQYLETYSDLIAHLANLFSHASKVTGIIIDGIDAYLKTIDEKKDGTYKDCLTKLFGLLVDIGGHYSSREETFEIGDTCPVMCSFDCEIENVNERTLVNSLGLHFFDQIVNIEPCNIFGSKEGFKMIDTSENGIYYFVEDGQIYLHRITKKINE
uniref:DNA recombination and repair protein Rad51-like C-terminal domain-containing protein n=1 Tax=Tetranychus urticae TaxID=32264 RepID=T1KIC8_TETUR